MLELSSLKIFCVDNNGIIDDLIDESERKGYKIDIACEFPSLEITESLDSDAVVINRFSKDAGIFINRISGIKELDRAAVLLIENDEKISEQFERIDEVISPDSDLKFLPEKIKYNIRIRHLKLKLEKRDHDLESALEQKNHYKNEFEAIESESKENHNFLHNSLKQVSLMVEDKKVLEDELKRAENLYKSNFDNFINLLSTLIEGKRQYHKGHSKKVAEISVFLAKSLELGDEEVKDIEIAALLHEMGKISIPDELSMKNPEEYKDSERDLLTQHPVVGSDMLEGFSDFETIAKIIRHIHEYVDGTGFPDALRRRAIPMGSKIISVANIYDNLVYRSNYSVTEAFSVIEDLIGIRYDSKVVNHLHKYANQNPVMDIDRSQEINIYEIKPGMTLASGIFTPLGAKLLPVGYVLTQKDIDKISSYHKLTPINETVYIKD